MNIFSGLLFQQGHIQDPALAVSLAGVDADASSHEAGVEPSAPEPRQDCRVPFKRGAVFAVCSTALSPFR